MPSLTAFILSKHQDLVDALFYQHYGFLELDEKGLALFLPLASVPDKP
jgi:hypothetical protein